MQFVGLAYSIDREKIRRSKVVYADETGEKVDGKKHWLWRFTTETETLAVIRKSRRKKVLEETSRKDFDGVIVCDGCGPILTSPGTSSATGPICSGKWTGSPNRLRKQNL